MSCVSYSTNLRSIHSDICDVKTKSRFRDELGQEHNVILRQSGLHIQLYAPTDIIKRALLEYE